MCAYMLPCIYKAVKAEISTEVIHLSTVKKDIIHRIIHKKEIIYSQNQHNFSTKSKLLIHSLKVIFPQPDIWYPLFAEGFPQYYPQVVDNKNEKLCNFWNFYEKTANLKIEIYINIRY